MVRGGYDVSVVPYSNVAREAYAEGWRTGKV
jgi:hypothetical protein